MVGKVLVLKDMLLMLSSVGTDATIAQHIQTIIDRKFEPLVKRLIIKHLGDQDDDLIMFVLEHLKDHKPPKSLVEGLEPVCSG